MAELAGPRWADGWVTPASASTSLSSFDLPDEIKDAVREGEMSERDTRIYQGLTPVQQRALHRARVAGDLERPR
ncbi:MAG: hypothetical protein R3C44_22155 [Chloroflexota bacterium]